MATNATGQGKSRISLVVDDSLKSRIARKAQANGVSMNAYIELAISEALRQGMNTETRAIYESDIESAEHDKYDTKLLNDLQNKRKTDKQQA